MNSEVFFEDFLLGQIDAFGEYPVSREEVIEFATRFDPQDMHLSDQAASRNAVFGRLSASGVHTFAMTSKLLAAHYKTRGVRVIAGLGMDGMRLLSPVHPGDVIRLRTEIEELRRSKSRPNAGVVVTKVEALNAAGKVVLIYHSALLIEAREAAADDRLVQKAAIEKSTGAAQHSVGQAFWDALHAGRLSLQICEACSQWTWPPQWRCGRCGSWNMGWKDVDPSGVVHSLTHAYHPFSAEMEGRTPLLTLLVELPQADGIRLLGQATGDESRLTIGSRVTIQFGHPEDAGIRWQWAAEASS